MADNKTTVVKSEGNNLGLILVALAILIAAGVGYMFYQSQHSKDNAVSGAASAVGSAAKDVGDAAKSTTK